MQEVADLIHVSVSTVRRLIDRGELRAVHVGRLVRIERAEVERYLRETPP